MDNLLKMESDCTRIVISFLLDFEFLNLFHTASMFHTMCNDIWKHRLFLRYGPTINKSDLALLEAPAQINWLYWYIYSQKIKNNPPIEGDDADIIISIGQDCAKASILGCQDLIGDSNLRPSGFPFANPVITQNFIGSCLGPGGSCLGSSIPFRPSKLFHLSQFGKYVPRTIFLDANDSNFNMIGGTNFSSSLFSPKMFLDSKDLPGINNMIELLLGDAHTDISILLMLPLSSLTLLIVQELSEMLRNRFLNSSSVYSFIIFAFAESSSDECAPALDFVLTTFPNIKIVLVDWDGVGAAWTQRDGASHPLLRRQVDCGSEVGGKVAFSSRLHEDLVFNFRGMEFFAEHAESQSQSKTQSLAIFQPRHFGSAAYIAGALRTNSVRRVALSSRAFPRLFLFGVSPLVPLSPFAVQSPSQAHRCRMENLFLAASLRTSLLGPLSLDLSLDRPELQQLSCFMGSYLGRLAWISSTNSQLSRELYGLLGFSEWQRDALGWGSGASSVHYTMSGHGVAYFQQISLFFTGLQLLEYVFSLLGGCKQLGFEELSSELSASDEEFEALASLAAPAVVGGGLCRPHSDDLCGACVRGCQARGLLTLAEEVQVQGRLLDALAGFGEEGEGEADVPCGGDEDDK